MSRLLMLALIGLMTVSCAGGGSRQSNYLNQPGESPADVYIQLGVGYMSMGNNGAALESLKKALEVDSRSSNAHGVIGVLYDRLEEEVLAERHFKRAVLLEPGNASAQNNYGRFLCKKGEWNEAASHFKAAYHNPLNPRKWLALANAGQCELKNNQLDKAEELFRKALEINPRFPNALSSMAKIRFKKGNYLSVRAYLQRFRVVSYHTAETLWLGIQSEHELGHKDAVAGYVVTLRSKFPDSEEVKMLDEKFPHYR